MVTGVLATASADGAASRETPVEALVAAGRRLYSEGLGASGAPVNAVVQGDVPVIGTQVTCASCHGRSGMGAIESGRIPSALSGPLLFAPDAQRGRPAYGDTTLARALREGIDPAGRELDPLMPRFQLADADVAALTAYLRQLGARPSPGVEPDAVRFATIVAGDVPASEAEAMIDVLETFVADRNRGGPQRLRGGHVFGQEKETYRRWSLDIWRLTGPVDSWRGQLETRYRARPVFAVVSGRASGSWQPIHDFCEARELVCLLPNADLAPAEDENYYSLYFSRGLGLEAEIIADELLTSRRAADVLQILGRNTSDTAAAAERLGGALARSGGHARCLALEERPDAAAALSRAISDPASAVVVWLPGETVRGMESIVAGTGLPPPLVFSSTLLDADWNAVPAALRARSQIVHLFRLPGDRDPQLGRFRAWADARGIARRHERLQAQTYFACLAATEGIKHIGLFPSRDFFVTREYFMELLDHASNLATYLPLYPRPGFGPGQRTLSRGGYVVDLSGRSDPSWTVPAPSSDRAGAGSTTSGSCGNL